MFCESEVMIVFKYLYSIVFTEYFDTLFIFQSHIEV